jgi:ParB family chromosome partitioning protein
MSEIRKQVLGRGLSSLLGSSDEEEKEGASLSPLDLPIVNIEAGTYQPRQSFPDNELQSLSVSIKEKGILQPIVVRSHPLHEGKYEIVAGERRWRAAKLINLETIPAIVREFSDKEVLEVGLLENLQRQDLDPIDEASGYRRLAEEFNHTQESLSRIVGKSRSHVANTLRLLTLPENVKDYLRKGTLSAGHGRAIMAAEDPEYLAEMIIEKNLNVRQAETLAKQSLSKNDHEGASKAPDPEREIVRQQLSDLLGAPVDLVLKGVGGKIVITFKNPNELDQILQKFNQIGVQPSYGVSVLS